MITVIVQHTSAELKLSGGLSSAEDLARIKNDIDKKDRTFNEDKKCFIVKNLDRYRDLPYIAKALEDRKRQLELF